MKPFSSRCSAVMGGLVLAVQSSMTAPAQAQTAPVERRPAPAGAGPAGGRQWHPPGADGAPGETPPGGRPRAEARSVPDAQRELPGGISRASRFLRAAPRDSAECAVSTSRASGSGQNDDYRPRNERVELVAGILGGPGRLHRRRPSCSRPSIWLIRTTLEQRRWSRLSKIQAEVHSKLMDRFSSNDELLTYVQTPSGRRFLESGPSPLQETGTGDGRRRSRGFSGRCRSERCCSWAASGCCS